MPSSDSLPSLTVVVIVYNRIDYTKRTLASLEATCPPKTEYVVWDNSTDMAVTAWLATWRDQDPIHRILNGSENIGWGSAVNRALQLVTTENILISNNDVEYKEGWYPLCLTYMMKYPKIGILGLWKHRAHGVRQELQDVFIKDDMPAVAWFTTRKILDDVGPIAERGPCPTKGGNGEDTNYTGRAMEKGYWVCGPREDLAVHIDGY